MCTAWGAPGLGSDEPHRGNGEGALDGCDLHGTRLLPFVSRDVVRCRTILDHQQARPRNCGAHYGLQCPEGSRSWWSLGYLFTSLLALDPVSGTVYAFPEGAIGYVELHRDVECLVCALVELRKVETDRDNGVAPEALAARLREAVGTFDPTPFTDGESQWSLAVEELEHGIW
ncbi:SUKH-4 family immunity protein [Streptomyces sp. NRRL S-448]